MKNNICINSSDFSTCCICGSGVLFSEEWGANTCNNCYSVHSITIPTDEELSAYYLSFNETYTGGGRESNRERRQIKYAEKYLQLVKQWGKGTTLIDVGSSTNPFPNLAAVNGYDVCVCDYVSPKELLSTVRFVKGSLDDRRLPEIVGCEFDIVTAFAVIEHCRYPQIAVKNLVKLCKPGGILILTTPLVGSFSDRNAAGRTAWFFPPEHLNLFSNVGMKAIFKRFEANYIHFSKFELTKLRWLLRYGLSFGEGVIGKALRKVLPVRYHKMKNTRLTKVQEIGIWVFIRC